jgi:hypothetical protein
MSPLARPREKSRAEGGKQWEEADGGAIGAGYRLEIENVLGGRRQNDPVAPARPNYRTDLESSVCAQFSAPAVLLKCRRLFRASAGYRESFKK